MQNIGTSVSSLAERVRAKAEQERQEIESLTRQQFSALSESLRQSSQNALSTTEAAILAQLGNLESSISSRSRTLHRAFGWACLRSLLLSLSILMGAGLGIGNEIGLHLVPDRATGTPLPLPAWVIWPAIAILGVSMLGVLQAPWRSVLAMIAGCVLTWGIYSIVHAGFGMVVGAFAGALAVGFAGHFYNALSGQPAILVKIPGIITLVPGSVGFRGLHALMAQDSATGVGLLTDMVLTGAVLAVGLLLADNLAPLAFARLRRRRTAARLATTAGERSR